MNKSEISTSEESKYRPGMLLYETVPFGLYSFSERILFAGETLDVTFIYSLNKNMKTFF